MVRATVRFLRRRTLPSALLLGLYALPGQLAASPGVVAAVSEPEATPRHGAVGREGAGPDTLSDAEQILDEKGLRLRVTPLKGLERPWALAFLPDGSILVTERPGRLPGETDDDWDRLTGPAATAVVARGRYDNAHTLSDVEDLFISDAATSGVSAARIAFGTDGNLYMSIGAPSYDLAQGGTNRAGSAEQAQDPTSHAGKILRLNDDGGVPGDNPFVHTPGYRPEIFALGVRNVTGLVVHPVTGELWEVEHGPLGGDEINIIEAGRNYGWPQVSYGRAYSGDRSGAGSGPILESPVASGMTEPRLYWSPNIAPGGLAIYRGSRFVDWQGDALIGGLQGTQLQHVDLTSQGLPRDQHSLLLSLGQRIREVREGPDGLLYLLTDHDQGALLRISPVVD